jgi:hypothetical protein
MKEKDFIFVYFKRFDTLNKGLLRVLIFLTIPATIINIMAGLYHIFIRGDGVGVTLIISTPIFYVAFWVVFRLLVWIYDGFKSKD